MATEERSGVDFYDFLTPSGKAALAIEYMQGPRQFQPGGTYPPGVSPMASASEVDMIVAKRFADKFHRTELCPMGKYPEGYIAPPSVAGRLAADGYLR